MARKRRSTENLAFLPWWLNLAIAFLSLLIVGAFLKPIGVVLFFFFGAMATLSALRALLNHERLERQTGIDSIRELSWKQFENLLGEAFRRQGYSVTETLGCGADGGVDLVLRRNSATILVQCKLRGTRNVAVQTVRELYGVMIDRGAAGAKLITTTNFSRDAIAFAAGKTIDLINGQSLLKLLREVQRSGKIAAADAEAPSNPACPNCNSEMVLREAKRGKNVGEKFWGCPRFPQCHGTRKYTVLN